MFHKQIFEGDYTPKGMVQMSTGFVIQTIIEIILALFVLWCFLNEPRLIRFEDHVKDYFVRLVRVRRKRKITRERVKLNQKSRYSPKAPADEPLHVA